MRSLLVGLLVSTVAHLDISHAQEAEARPSPRYSVRRVPAPWGYSFTPYHINNRGEMAGYLQGQANGPYDGVTHAGFYNGRYTIDLHRWAAGATFRTPSLPVDLDEKGRVLFRTLQGPDRHFLFEHGRATEFSRLVRRKDLEPVAINTRGQFVGRAGGVNEQGGQPFVYAKGRVHLLGTLPGYPYGVAGGISENGRIVGIVEAEVDGDDIRPVLFSPDGPIDLGLPERESYAQSVNNRGDILGHSTEGPDGGHGVLWQDRKIVRLPFTAMGMNEAGDVVGFENRGWPRRAMLYSRGTISELSTLVPANSGWELSQAHDINDRGQIIGFGIWRGEEWGFVLTPLRRTQ